MNELCLSEFGLETVEDAARRRNRSVEAVRVWIRSGAIPVLIVGAGRSARFLVRVRDVDGYQPAPRGAPTGNANAKKESSESLEKTGARKKSRKKSRNRCNKTGSQTYIYVETHATPGHTARDAHEEDER